MIVFLNEKMCPFLRLYIANVTELFQVHLTLLHFRLSNDNFSFYSGELLTHCKKSAKNQISQTWKMPPKLIKKSCSLFYSALPAPTALVIGFCFSIMQSFLQKTDFCHLILQLTLRLIE